MSAQTQTVSGFTVTVNPAPVPALVVNPTSGGALPNEQVGQAAQVDLVTVSGGAAPYTATVVSGSLPAGMSITSRTNQVTGAVTFEMVGTPTTAGSSPFGLLITDSTP